MIVPLAYASPSALLADGGRQLLGMCGDQHRPVHFRGIVRQHAFLLRVVLRALGSVIWSDDTWAADGAVLDPVITVHRDRLFFEAFSQDQSAYAMVILDRDLFAVEGEVKTGTTHVDFTAWLWQALGELRSSRVTEFAVGSEGLAVATRGGGGRFEARVDLPDSWVRGFLQVQGAMAMPGTRLSVRPVDLLAAVRFLRYTKARLSPRALRYEFVPGADARIVLEPWEHAVPLRDAAHGYAEPHTIRLWGRRRLALLEPLLPFAEGVDVYLKGRALPSFYAVRLPGMTFVLGITGWSGQAWTGAASFDLLQDARPVPAELGNQALALLRERECLAETELARTGGVDLPVAASALQQLCRHGRAVFDVERRQYRHRELFAAPIDVAKFYPPDERIEWAHAVLGRGEVNVTACAPRETRKQKYLRGPSGRELREIVFRDWLVEGCVGEQPVVEVVIGERGAVVFGRCGCTFFEDHLLARGPCQHMLVLLWASAPHRLDLPTSRPAEAPLTEPATENGAEDGDIDEPAEDGDDAER